MGAPERRRARDVPWTEGAPVPVDATVPLVALAVIPARGGSKGIPGKNLREVGGVSLLVHAIRAAREAERVSEFVVSTDSDEIAGAATAAGARVVVRPSELATDDAPVAAALSHALETVEAEGSGPFDVVVLLQPTAPLRTGTHVDGALRALENAPTADSVVSVCVVEDAHPGRMYRLPGDGTMTPLWPEWERSPRQALPPVYHRNGAIYAVRRDTLLRHGLAIGRRPVPYVMPPELQANIDAERDLIVADALARAWAEGRLPS